MEHPCLVRDFNPSSASRMYHFFCWKRLCVDAPPTVADNTNLFLSTISACAYHKKPRKTRKYNNRVKDVEKRLKPNRKEVYANWYMWYETTDTIPSHQKIHDALHSLHNNHNSLPSINSIGSSWATCCYLVVAKANHPLAQITSLPPYQTLGRPAFGYANSDDRRERLWVRGDHRELDQEPVPIYRHSERATARCIFS